MSWFDAAGLANIAKSALKEAQRTIDKALDIREDELAAAPTNTPVDTNSDDFFGSWGISQSGNIQATKAVEASTEIITKSPTKSTNKMTTSLWGSFTGSFFEASNREFIKPRGSVESLDDSVDLGDEGFSRSKLVVQQSDDGEGSCFSRLSSISNECDDDKGIEKEGKSDLKPISEQGQLSDVILDSLTEQVNLSQTTNQATTMRKHEHSNINRLSVISSGSGKTSSESVEIVSGGTGCTTSPDSELQSISTSSSVIGSKVSESVEVLPDSLTSPSSVEILPIETTSSQSCSNSDEFASPLVSPIVEENTSPESVEVIPGDPDNDNSVADDSISYASISESTSTTLLETALNAKSQRPLTKMDTLNDTHGFSEPITKGPSRSSMHLSLTQINSQLIDTQPQSSKENLNNLVESSNIIDIPQENNLYEAQTQADDEGSQSDRTVIASDNVMESSSDTSTTTESNTNSFYVKNMLADAMTEKSAAEQIDPNQKSQLMMEISLTSSITEDTQKDPDILENISISQLEMPPRETSPLSSESRSDLVKIGSDQTSGHTSGDENETTTSSDIEIISSPNGDSSSTQSRHSPAKLAGMKHKAGDANVDVLLGKMTFKKIKGHNRELSEASSISDDSHSSEIDRLIKRVSDMTEILELREAKLIEINRRNAELQELNNDLRHQLDIVLTKQMESAELSQVTEEYTQRLSALEKKFQQAIRDKDILRKQLEQSKQEAASRMSKGELELLMSEKDEVIKELREEGEKLSKQQLQHSNIIKKLRAKEKEHETTIKHLKENVEDLTSETERLKRSLAAKEEVERSQIEAVHQLTSKNKKLEYEVTQLQSQLDDVSQKYETVKRSLDAAKKELVDKNKTSSVLHAREQMLQSLENEKRMTESQNEEIINQLEDLRFKLHQADQEYLKKEQNLRSENHELLRRLEETERRNEELAQSVMEATKPLVRQLESLQATHNMKLVAFEKVEQTLLLKINEIQSKFQSASDAERLAREECLNMRSKVSSLETQLSTATYQNEMVKMEIEQQKTEKIIVEQEMRREVDLLDQQIKSAHEVNENLKREISALEQQLSIEKAATEAEKRKNSALQDQVKDNKNEPLPTSVATKSSSPTTRTASPTLSVGRLSLSESLASSIWLPDEQFEMNPTPRYAFGNMLELQILQNDLKQRDGELQQLQWELNRREQEKKLMSSEISKLLIRVEELEIKFSEFDSLKVQFAEVQQQYDTLCQLYGEKVEEAEELRLDLVDVKELYKAQLDELLKQQKGGNS